MAFMEDGYFTVGGIASPLAASTTRSLLQDADPVLYNILDFYEGVINLHMKARWNAEVALAGRADLTDLCVADKVPFDPTPYMQETQYKLPLLAVFRENEKYEWKTSGWYHITSKLNILWIMPPLSAGQAERMNAFRAHVTRTILDRTLMGFDSNYNDGYQPWRESGLEKISILKTDFGSFPDPHTDLFLPTVWIEAELVERRMPDANPSQNFPGLTGVDDSVDLVDFVNGVCT